MSDTLHIEKLEPRPMTDVEKRVIKQLTETGILDAIPDEVLVDMIADTCATNSIKADFQYLITVLSAIDRTNFSVEALMLEIHKRRAEQVLVNMLGKLEDGASDETLNRVVEAVNNAGRIVFKDGVTPRSLYDELKARMAAKAPR